MKMEAEVDGQKIVMLLMPIKIFEKEKPKAEPVEESA